MAGRQRLRYHLAGNGRTIAALLVVAGLLTLGGVGWAYVTPPTTEVTERTQTRTVHSELHTSAVVTGDSVLYSNGTRLRDEPIYLASPTPGARVNVTTTTPPNASVRVTQRLDLVYSVARENEVFWEESRTLVREETTRSGNVTAGARLDVGAVSDRLDRIRDEVGTAGTPRVELRLTVTYEMDGYEGRLQTTVPVRLGEDWYSIGTDSVERTHGTPVTRTVTVPRRNPGLYLGGGLAGGLSLVAGLVLTGLRRRRWIGRCSERELAHGVHRARYSDWISTGELPAELAGPTVRTSSLEDLVDVAIDTGNRVVHDPERGLYVVFAETATYRYEYFTFGGNSGRGEG